MKLVRFVVLVLCLLWAVSSLANNAGQKPLLLQAAIEGDAKAQYQLALIYQEEAIDTKGGYFEPDPELWRTAIHWLEAASDQGHLKAQETLLTRMYRSTGNADEEEKWLRLGTKLAENGHKYAQYLLAEFYFAKSVGGRLCDFDPFEPAIHWYSTLLDGINIDDEVIFPQDVTHDNEVTVADVQWHLNYLKELLQ